jgi:RNA polymerase sigma factor (TIGR02999 family)
MPPDEGITSLLGDAAHSPASAEKLLDVVYDQLRKVAQQRMLQERRDHTLTATALVHEAYLRLVGDNPVPWQNRAHFFSACAEAMRRILIEHARARGRLKRGGDEHGRAPARVPLGLLDLAEHDDLDTILMLDDALRRLESEDPDVAAVVRLRFYAGLGVDEVASALGVSPSTIDRDWAWGRAWLHKALRAGPA